MIRLLVVGCCAAVAAFSTPLLWAVELREADVIIYGGNAGGVAAAVQVVRMGKKVILIEPSQHIGGLTSGGLGATDIGNKRAIGGIAREFYQRVKKYYSDEAAWRWQKRDEYRGNRGSDSLQEDAMWTFEPHVAERILREWLAELSIACDTGTRLKLPGGVKKEGNRIVRIESEDGVFYAGQVFLDCTYEGDLMAAAGVKYHVGREANAQYGETLNGVAVKHAHSHQFIRPVDPYVVPGDPSSGLLFGIQADGPGEEGSGNRGVQAYNFRICATNHPENRLPWPKPKDYDERLYELLLRNFEAGDERIPWNPVAMPNRKTDSNNNFAVSTDWIGQNYDYPDGDYATRARIFRAHLNYTQGLFWTLANHDRVPAKVRAYFSQWGLAKDEFVDHGHWPHQMYVREARRMIAAYVMTQHDCQGRKQAEDSVGLGAYNMDSHNVQRYVDASGHVRNEGDVQVGVSPYPISYRSIVPREEECTNLAVPVCLSASHIAYGSIRMEPVFMVLGQSSATAACLAIDARSSLQAVPYDKLRARLLADKQVLDWDGPKRADGQAALDPKQMAGVVLDDPQAARRGAWQSSSSLPGYVGAGYLHDGDAAKGELEARFATRLPADGEYDVLVIFLPNPNRAGAVPVVVEHAGGSFRTTIDQRQGRSGSSSFLKLGRFKFTRAADAAVTISNAGTKGHVIVDAVQFLPAAK